MEQENYNVFSLLIQGVPAVFVVYVSLRLATFENRFLEKLDNRFVGKEVYKDKVKSLEAEHRALWDRIKEAISR